MGDNVEPKISSRRRQMAGVFLALLVLVFAEPEAHAQAGPDPGVAAMSRAFQTWAASNGIGNAALVISRDGVEIGTASFGSWNVDTIAPIASTSKAITAQCVFSLIDGNRIALTDTVDRHLSAAFLSSLSATGRTNAAQITIEQLLRHTSGFQGNGNATAPGEPTQTQYTTGAADAHPDEWFSRQALNRALLNPPGSNFAYANVNYALLGVVIRTVTGMSYQDFCRQTVLTPLGAANAVVAAGNSAMEAFGGWSISARQYASFYSRSFARGVISEREADFLDRAFDPSCSVCGYGAGVFVLPAGYSLSIATLPKPPDISMIPGTASAGSTVLPVPGATAMLIPIFHPEIAPYELNHNGDWNSTATTPRQFSSFAIYWPNGVSAVMICDRGGIAGPLNAFYNAISTPAQTIQ